MVDPNLQNLIYDAVNHNDVKSASLAVGIIKKGLKENPKEYEHFSDAMLQLQFVRLHAIGEEAVMDLLANHLMVAFDVPNYDFKEKIDLAIENIETEVERMEFVLSLEKIFKENKATIGKNMLTISGAQVQPTLQNWIADYLTVHGQTSERTGYETAEYLSKSPNAKQLSEAERFDLLDILTIYNNLYNSAYQIKSAQSLPPSPESLNELQLVPSLLDEETASEGTPKDASVLSAIKKNVSNKQGIIKEDPLAAKTEVVEQPKRNLDFDIAKPVMDEDTSVHAGIHLSSPDVGNAEMKNRVQEILKQRLKPVPPSAADAPLKASPTKVEDTHQAEIDKKLEELKKRLNSK
jgi:hypothetical protein